MYIRTGCGQILYTMPHIRDNEVVLDLLSQYYTLLDETCALYILQLCSGDGQVLGVKGSNSLHVHLQRPPPLYANFSSSPKQA